MKVTRFISFKEYFELNKFGRISADSWGKFIREDSESAYSRDKQVIFLFSQDYPLHYQNNYIQLTLDVKPVGSGTALYHSFNPDGDTPDEKYLTNKYSEVYVESYTLQDVVSAKPPSLLGTRLKSSLRELLDSFCYVLWDNEDGSLSDDPQSICIDCDSFIPHPNGLLIQRLYNGLLKEVIIYFNP